MNKIIALLILLPTISWALPIDWHGKFGVDSTMIQHYRFIDANNANAVTAGSMEVAPVSGNLNTASIQSYIFSLQPEMIINDAATFKAEITSGYGKGGLLGQNTTTSKSSTTSGNTLFLNNEDQGTNTLSLGLFYLELYSDLATYQVGRHSKDWGMGALYNSGKNLWDRHTFAYDGVTMNFKLNNFIISPFWARVNSGQGLTRINHTKEYGLSFLYDNAERDISLGILYAKKQNGSQSTAYTGINGNSLGNNDVTILDLYFKTEWNKFSIEIEAPLIDGDLGQVYSANNNTKYKSKAVLVETHYQWSDSLKLGFKMGQVSGDDPNDTSKFGAMYLNPNFKIGNILFGYNPMSIADPSNNSYFDAYVTNAKYFAVLTTYQSGKWNWLGTFLYAKADEVAQAGKKGFNHLKNKVYTATLDQSDDLGMEFDLNATYQWNTEISIKFDLGYLATGDYFAFTNDAAKENTTSNVFMLKFGLGVEF